MGFLRISVVSIVASASLIYPCKSAMGMIAVGGGWYCQEISVMGQSQGIGNCFDMGGGGGYPSGGVWDIGGGGSGTGTGGGTGSGSGSGSGSTDEPDTTDRDVSSKLQCAMKEYFHPDIRLGPGRTMKKVNAYAYGLKKPGGGFSGYVFRATKTSPGPEWGLADGVTFPGTAYGRLYKTAYEAGYHVLRGERANAAPRTLTGNLTTFEMSLLVAGHEAAHLRRAGVSEIEAEWYGIDALLNYRADKGKACSKEEPPPPK